MGKSPFVKLARLADMDPGVVTSMIAVSGGDLWLMSPPNGQRGLF